MLRKDVLFACLVPISLVNRAPADEGEKENLRDAKKIILLDPELVWIVHKVPDVGTHQVHMRRLNMFGPEPDMLGVMTGPPNIKTEDWLPKQEELFANKNNGYTEHNTLKKNGLWHYIAKDNKLRLIVPEEHRDELVV